MIQGARLAAMLPHAGAMVLLDGVEAWGEDWVACRSRSHLDPANPLRREGQLASVCGIEYALQAAALHGAMRAGGVAQAAGYVARLQRVRLHAHRLDDPAHGLLRVEARLEHAEAGGMLYGLAVQAASGAVLVEGRAAIALPVPGR